MYIIARLKNCIPRWQRQRHVQSKLFHINIVEHEHHWQLNKQMSNEDLFIRPPSILGSIYNILMQKIEVN